MNRRDVIAGIWLIGLGILFLFDFFWPGILILIGLSMIVTAMMPPVKKEAPPAPPPPAQVIDAALKDEPAPEKEESLPSVLAEQADLIYRQSLLPETCPVCGAPVKKNAANVAWRDEETAECPFCAAKLTISKPPTAQG